MLGEFRAKDAYGAGYRERYDAAYDEINAAREKNQVGASDPEADFVMSNELESDAIEDAAKAAIEFIAGYQDRTGLSTEHALDAMLLATLEVAAITLGNKADVVAWMHDVVGRVTRSVAPN